MRALLFAGWFASQLDWAPRTAMARIRWQSGDEAAGVPTPAGAMAVEGLLAVEPGQPGRLHHFCQSAAEGEGLLAVELRSPTATFAIHKNHGEQTATVVVTTAEACGLPRKCALAPEDDAALISEELAHLTRHAVYERALAMAAALAAAESARLPAASSGPF